MLDRHVRAGAGDAADLLAYSLKEGVLASPVGVMEWRQPWIPIYLEWEARLDRSDRLAGWRLDEIDLVPVEADDLTLTSRTFTGRSLLAAAATKALADAVSTFLDAEDRLDAAGRGVLTETQETQLATLATTVATADLMAASLAGMHDSLLGFDPDAAARPVIRFPPRCPSCCAAGSSPSPVCALVDCLRSGAGPGPPPLGAAGLGRAHRPQASDGR